MFQRNSNQVTEEDAKQKLRLSGVGCAAFDTTSYWFAILWFRALNLLSGFVLGSPEFNSSTALCK